MSKSTAMMMQLATSDGENRQQMIVFPAKKSVFRRSLTGDTRTRWRHAGVGDLPTWVEGYVNLTRTAATPMDLTHGPVLMEVTPDECDEAEGGSFPRNVGLRFARVMETMDAEGAIVNPNVKDWLDEWQSAIDAGDDTWLDAQTHAAGTARAVPAAAPAPTAPEPEPTPAPSTHGWTYPVVMSGYVTRPNGDRYKVRKIEGTQDVKVLQDSRSYGEHVFLYGEPGTGKTALIEAAFGSDMVTMLGTEDTEVSDFVGQYGPRGGGSYGWTDGALTEAIERDVPLFIDEIGVIAPKTLTTLFSMMDGRKELRITANPDRGIVTAGPGFIVLAATNPHAPGVRISEALTSRFALHMEVGTDYAMMRELGVPDVLVTAGENLNTRRLAGEDVWAPQARELLRAKMQWDTRGEAFAVRNMIAGAPEDDREVVAEVLARTTGKKRKPLTL